MKILITGGCGYVGSVLIPKLIDDGHDIISVDTKWFGDYLPSHKKLRNIKSDLSNI
jgi:nucleoside-diphosphate-sugar epimerase